MVSQGFFALRINTKGALKVTLSLDACAYYIISQKLQEKIGFAHFSIETNNQAPFSNGTLQVGYALGSQAGTRFFNTPQNNLEIMIYN